MADTVELAIVGLGKIGGGLAQRALECDMRVVGFDRRGLSQELRDAGVSEIEGLDELRDALHPPRAVLLYIPAGLAVDEVLDELAGILEPGDAVIDGGNSYWGDSVRRQSRLAESCIHLLDVGTSGGLEGARFAPCFMAGGTMQGVRIAEPILRRLATPGGYVHAGPPGAGHFAKLVHNGIEFGMLQAIGEGIDMLAHSPLDVSIGDVLSCWRHGSVIRGWLIELMEEAYRSQGGLQDVPPYVEDTGEVGWLVQDSIELEVPIPVIAQAVMQLHASRDERQNWARAIAMMRQGFGGHPLGPDESVAQSRREARVGSFPKTS